MLDTIAFKIIYVILSYLLGSVCFGYVFAKALGKRDFGKKDLPGGTGSSRQLGIKIGLTIGFLDTLKGVVPPLLATKLLGLDIYATVLASLAVVIGHNWPVFLGFRGGRGEATTIGAERQGNTKVSEKEVAL